MRTEAEIMNGDDYGPEPDQGDWMYEQAKPAADLSRRGFFGAVAGFVSWLRGIGGPPSSLPIPALAPVDPSAGAFVFAKTLNERATFRWVAAPCAELIIPATGTTGLSESWTIDKDFEL